MKLFNIILLLLIALAARCQDSEINETIDLLRVQVTALEDDIISLANENTKLQDSFLTVLDSLGLVIEGLEDSQPSNPIFLYMQDTAYLFVSDSNGYFAEIRKTGSQINTEITKGPLRIVSYFGDSRSVYFMNGNASSLSVLEDSINYKVSTEDWEIKLDKK